MRIGMISLGCDKNRVDSERMLFALSQAGHTLVQNTEDAEIMIINTCAFIKPAKEEAINTILEVAQYKQKGLKKLIVTGCFATRYGSKVDFDEVDCFVNVADEHNIVKIVNALTSTNCPQTEIIGRILTTPSHYAYLRIADGCNNRCSYCAIPSIRGKYVSEPIDSLVAEAKGLCESGVRELILVAQDTTNYGRDLYGKPMLVELCKRLCQLPFWRVRLLYTYPELITDELLDFMVSEPKMAKYLDIPMQHISTPVLKKMNRRSTGDSIRKLIDLIRQKGDFAIRSSFIVGFPTECEADHVELCDFLSSALNYAGFFAFSPEEDTLAYTYKPAVNKTTVKKWVKELEIIQCSGTINHNQRYLNTSIEVIYEGIDYDRQLFYGRTEFNAPEIDTYVYFSSDIPLDIGNIYNVRIEKADFHLYGKVE